MTNKIGFVIVTYNSEKYIDHCLKSIKNQHNFDINIVVVDNNSHDNTVNLIESHEGVAIIRNRKFWICQSSQSRP